jgi:acyl phosphate:glycerol-3-phosphate acyltransferase
MEVLYPVLRANPRRYNAPAMLFMPLLLIPIAYLLGSIPFGLLVGLAKGVDPRTAGSKNIGATNVGRLLGGRYFAVVFTLDVLKAFLPTFIGGILLYRLADIPVQTACLLWMAVGMACVLGHVFPVYLGFRGGKGVSAAAGVLLGLFPWYTLPAIVAVVVFIVVFAIWRYVSLASITAAGAFPFFYVGFAALVFPIQDFWPHWPFLAGAVLVAGLIIWRHRSNIRRLLDGTEQPFRRKRSGSPASPSDRPAL